MPAGAAVSKAAAVRAFGATMHEGGTSVDDCVMMARKRADEAGLAFVHPFDDIDIVAGQAGLGVELAADVPELSTVVIPIGGGGLAAGAAMAIKQRHPKVTVVGVQAEVCASYRESLRAGRPIASAPNYTIADGIAIKRPGDLTLALISNWLDDVVSVSEEAIADAMVFLLERSKLVVEGARSLFNAPRSLNESVRRRFSALSTIVPLHRSERLAPLRMGVRRTTAAEAACASSTRRTLNAAAHPG